MHQFDFINGYIDNNSDEFASYQRVYESIFGKIQQQLQRIKALLLKESIDFAKLDGKKLAYLCLKEKVTDIELMSCLGNIPLKSRLSQYPPSRFMGKQGKMKAVTLIASYWKMRSIREKYQTLKKNTIIIQRFFRKKLYRLSLEKKIEERNNKILENFEKRQNRFAKEYRIIKEQKRIEIHLASVEVD